MRERKLCAIYLAAGYSRRMGRNKLTLPLGHTFLGCKALQTAIETQLFEKIFVMIQPNDSLQWILPLKKLDSLAFITVHESSEGLSVTLKKGIKQVMDYGADGAMILLADQPFITTGMLRRLVTTFQNDSDCVFVAASHQKMIQPPLVVSREIFSEFKHLRGDEGARKLLRDSKGMKGMTIDFQQDFLTDIDTYEEYVFWKERDT